MIIFRKMGLSLGFMFALMGMDIRPTTGPLHGRSVIPGVLLRDYPAKPIPFTAVQVHDSFWAPPLEIHRTVTIPFAFQKCEEIGDRLLRRVRFREVLC